MYLRWMVRKDELDLGLFTKIHTKDLLIPLDTHTHKISLTLGLLKRKIYDYKSVLELTQNLKKLDANDPIKYDFALYRLGQSKEIHTFFCSSFCWFYRFYCRWRRAYYSTSTHSLWNSCAFILSNKQTPKRLWFFYGYFNLF